MTEEFFTSLDPLGLHFSLEDLNSDSTAIRINAAILQLLFIPRNQTFQMELRFPRATISTKTEIREVRGGLLGMDNFITEYIKKIVKREL